MPRRKLPNDADSKNKLRHRDRSPAKGTTPFSEHEIAAAAAARRCFTWNRRCGRPWTRLNAPPRRIHLQPTSNI